MNWQALKSAVQSGNDTPEKMAALVPAQGPSVSRASIKICILGLGGPTLLAACEAALPAFYSDPDFDMINLADPVTQGILSSLVPATLSTEQLAAINALGTIQIPRWQSLGLPSAPGEGDIAYALTQ